MSDGGVHMLALIITLLLLRLISLKKEQQQQLRIVLLQCTSLCDVTGGQGALTSGPWCLCQ